MDTKLIVHIWGKGLHIGASHKEAPIDSKTNACLLTYASRGVPEVEVPTDSRTPYPHKFQDTDMPQAWSK